MRPKLYLLLLLLFVTASFSTHQFYVSIYQINYAPEKKMLQITSRIFTDDLNDALFKKHKQRTHIGEAGESSGDVVLMKKYLLEQFSVKVNGSLQTLHFLSHESEDNVIICYFNAKSIAKIKTIEIRNTALLELFDDQQNIIQANVSGKKQNLLLTNGNVSGVLKWE